MPKRILIIDDEESLVELVSDILEGEGFKVTSADNSETGLEKVYKTLPDLIILDVSLPTIGGLEVCRTIKHDERTRLIPVIMLTVHSSEWDKVVGLEMGADDYITKPFGKAELVARVKAALRRSDYTDKPKSMLRFGELRIDLEKRNVYSGKNLITLTPKEFDLLCLLADKKGKSLTREYLMERIFGYEYSCTTRTLDTHVKNIRKKLGRSGENIETIAGIGYRFAEK